MGDTRGYRRTGAGYRLPPDAARRVCVRPRHAQAQTCLSCPVLDPPYRHGAPSILLSAEHRGVLPDFFADMPDPRRGQGRHHPLPAGTASHGGLERISRADYPARYSNNRRVGR